MQDLTPEGRQVVQDLANRNGVSFDAALTLLLAVAAGGGTQAQFNHPELGGMGQWSQGGMIMIGDMFNQGLKYKVSSMCDELSGLLRNQPLFAPPPAPAQWTSTQMQSQGGGVSFSVQGGGFGNWWPADLGSPSSSGAQNDLRYAWFPGTRRLAIQQGGVTRVYDTGDHMIGGVSQQQSGDQSLTFTSQFGVVRVADLPLLSPAPHLAPEPQPQYAPQPAPEAAPAPQPIAPQTAASDGDVYAALEKLAGLRQKNIITEEEFAAKKAEMLSRL
jgi:hypothetical protein